MDEEYEVPVCAWCQTELDVEESEEGELALCPRCYREKLECEYENWQEQQEDVRRFQHEFD